MMTSKWKTPVSYLFLTLMALFFLMPIYLLLVTSMKSVVEVSRGDIWGLPDRINFDSWRIALVGSRAAGVSALWPNFLNSIYLAVPATLISAMLGSMNGYVLSKWKFRGANVLFPLIMFGMFIPYQSVLVPLVQLLQKMQFGPLKLYGTIPGLILVHVVYGIPITTLIFRNYYAAIPDEMIEAAKIDGAGIFRIYGSILFPLSVPGFVVVMIWQFTSVWNEFLFALVLNGNPKVQPITVALNNLAGSFQVDWSVQMAGALMAAIPTLLVYIFLGRFFMRGLLAGSLKG